MSWTTARNILCIRLDTIGDVIMTTAALAALKANRPDRRLTLLTSSAGAAIAPWVQDIDDVIVYDAPWLKATAVRTSSAPDFEMIERLRQARFDAAVIFTVYSQNPLPAALLCYLAEIPLRLAHCHENPYQLLTQWVKDPEPQIQRHEVQRQLDLVTSVAGCGSATQTDLKLTLSSVATERVKAKLRQGGIDLERPWVVIHPGATAASRRYPCELFAVVAERLVRDSNMQVVLTGTGTERLLVDAIQSQMNAPALSLVDQLEIGELIALIGLVPVLVSNNTAPVHMAAAVNTPVVTLYALTNPQHTPWKVPSQILFHDVPCRYCYKSICPEEHHHCLRLIDPERVVEAVLALYPKLSLV
jgi:lipopolysaccharide heptosyltransferase II